MNLDFSRYGYEVEKELGHNSLGGRVTYLARRIKNQQPVVIKQFQFAQFGASWAEYETFEQEIKILKTLEHPGIPLYLDSFQTDNGFCMVQEYIDAPSATETRSYAPEEIKEIAISALEILVYLQSQKPLIIHRDIKPENLLIDEQLNVYLVDFGFARSGGGEIAASSVVKGTMGFMPPEQLFNRQLTAASDLYGLGTTLICLVTGTKSVEIGNLTDANYNIHFRHLVPPLKRGWVNWLETMVQPRPQDRYPSAVEALTALKSLDVSRLPKVRLERDYLLLRADRYGEKVTKTLTISNPIPDTMLAGRWQVAPHPNDPPHTAYDHPWISFESAKFEGNEVECQITADTRYLLAQETYTRQLILHTNSDPETHRITLKIQTPPPKIKQTPYLGLGRLSFMACWLYLGWLFTNYSDIINWDYATSYCVYLLIAVSVIVEKNVGFHPTTSKIDPAKLIGSSLGASIGLIFIWSFFSLVKTANHPILIAVESIGMIFLASLGASVGVRANSGSLAISGCVFLALLMSITIFWGNYILNFGMLIIGSLFLFLLGGWFLKNRVKSRVAEQLKRGFYEQDAMIITFLTAGFCINLGATFKLFLKFGGDWQWVEPTELAIVGGLTLLSLATTAIPLLNLILFKRNKIIKAYRKAEPFLIKP